tara:strand:+ start:6296 stop:6493 length:198 start_codon:yes stop_codon:yes gene_type:complete
MISMHELNAQLKKAQKEILDYQKNCNHTKPAMKMNDKNEIKWHCTKCDMFIRIPTQKEVTEWLKR